MEALERAAPGEFCAKGARGDPSRPPPPTGARWKSLIIRSLFSGIEIEAAQLHQVMSGCGLSGPGFGVAEGRLGTDGEGFKMGTEGFALNVAFACSRFSLECSYVRKIWIDKNVETYRSVYEILVHYSVGKFKSFTFVLIS